MWLSVDPLAEHSPNKTPYHYCSNNPINRTDPTGMCDDPNCTHGAIRRGWDAIGRFFGAWGHSENATAKQSKVTAGPIQEIASQVTSATSAGVTQVDLIPENPLVKLDYSTSKTIGDAKIFNASSKTTFNFSEKTTENSIDGQLNLGVLNLNSETSTSSITFGGEISAFGRLGLGVSINLSSDILNSNISINGNGNLNGDNTSSSLSAGIKPVGILATGAAFILNRIFPSQFIPTPLLYNTITPITTTTQTMY
jgi:hypothetical protein